MPKIAKQLSDLQVRRITRVGWHAVGGVAGLLLQVRRPAQEGAQIPRSWILRVKVGDQRQPIGLGSYPQVSLADARAQASKLVIEARQGVNLKAKKRAQRSSLMVAAAKNRTFRECAEAYMDAHSTDYSSDKHRKQWPATLETYAYPVIGNMLVSDIAMRDVRNVLEQETIVDEKTKGKLWYVKTETAKRLLGRIKTVLDYATVNEYRSGTNPAQWTGYLSTQLPSPRKLQKKEHHPAVPYQLMGGFMKQLRKNSKHSRLQCKKAAMKNKRVCRTHGGASTGPKTEQGRQRCAEAKTIHGNETRKARTERAEGMRRLRALEDLGYALGIMQGTKTVGRKPLKILENRRNLKNNVLNKA